MNIPRYDPFQATSKKGACAKKSKKRKKKEQDLLHSVLQKAKQKEEETIKKRRKQEQNELVEAKRAKKTAKKKKAKKKKKRKRGTDDKAHQAHDDIGHSGSLPSARQQCKFSSEPLKTKMSKRKKWKDAEEEGGSESMHSEKANKTGLAEEPTDHGFQRDAKTHGITIPPAEEEEEEKEEEEGEKRRGEEGAFLEGADTDMPGRTYAVSRIERDFALEREMKPNEWLIDPKCRLSVEEVAGLNKAVLKNVREQCGIEKLLPVQSMVIPPLLKTFALGKLTAGSATHHQSKSVSHRRRSSRGEESTNTQNDRRRGTVLFDAVGGDLCVLAPTGSGKTLAYVIPIVNALVDRIVCRLRALVIVPTRDLVKQVSSVFRRVCAETTLRVAELYGQESFSKDQSKLVKSDQHLSSWSQAGWGSLKGGSVEPSLALHPYGVAKGAQPDAVKAGSHCPPSAREARSRADILVATPGRLVDMLNASTRDESPPPAMSAGNGGQVLRGFTLDYLQFLVMDEADKLLQDAYQDWLHKLASACEPFDHHSKKTTSPRAATTSSGSNKRPLHKLLFSATLTDNPQKLASLRLYNPKYFSASLRTRYTIPKSLRQYHVVCSVEDKILIAHQMAKQFHKSRTLVFAASIDTTHKVYLLLRELGIKNIAEYSGHLSQQERLHIVDQLKRGLVKVVVTSDAMARGLDIPNVDNVINYDAPLHVKTYVHRVGRSARAGKQGRAFTLLAKFQVRAFREMVRKAGAKKLHNWRWDGQEVKAKRPEYTKALASLKVTLEEEVKAQRGTYKPEGAAKRPRPASS